MKKLLLSVVCAAFAFNSLHAQTNVWHPSPGHIQIPIWPGAAPDPQPVPGPEYGTNSVMKDGKPLFWVGNVAKPTMTVYPPHGTNTGVAMVVFPGGGYNELAMDLEGTEICDWLNSRGITAVLLKYRVPTPHRVEPYGESLPALEDAQRTLGLVRLHAVDWQIDPHKIGVIGFSAGGHMVVAMSNRFSHRFYAPVDAADQVSCRPDFALALYPGHLWNDDDPLQLNPNISTNITTLTPPTFLLQNENDHVDNVNDALVYYIALKNANVPAELHVYAQGGHGFGLRHTKYAATDWPQLAERWLVTIGMTPQ